MTIALPNKAISAYYPLIYAVVLGLLGAVLNTLSFPFLPEVQLIFGNAVFILAAMSLKPRLALLTAILAVTPLYFIWGHPFGFVTFGLEALIVSYLRSRGTYTLFADILYWCVIGMPLTALLIWVTSTEVNVYWLFISLKQGFNGVLYASIACIVAFLLDTKLIFSWRQQPAIKRGMQQQLNYAMVLMTSLALIASTLAISRGLILSSQSIVETTLDDRAKKFSETLDVYLNNQKSALTIAGNWLSSAPKDQWQFALEQVHQSYAGFITMLVADETGEIINASPAARMRKPGGRSVKDRDYFQQAIIGQPLYVSPVFKGRGFGSDTIVAISTPIYGNDSSTQPIGIVEGSVDLMFIGEMASSKFGDEQIKIIVTDQHDNVIYAHKDFMLEPLYLFDYQYIVDSSAQDRIVLDTIDNFQFAYSQTESADGWKVYALIDYRVTVEEIEREYLMIFMSLVITLALTTAMSQQFGKRITRPLNFIINQVNKYDNHTIENFEPLHPNAASEVDRLYKVLQSEKRAIDEYQQKLEEKVRERTQALNDANEKLTALALIDGLTKVHNRRYLDENFALIQKTAQRNMALMSVVMLDLDHFKLLNDKYGHLTGDQVLKKVAELIGEEFSRETDRVIRFGGEEFVVIAPILQPLHWHRNSSRCE